MTVSPTKSSTNHSSLPPKNRFLSRIQTLISERFFETIGASLLFSLLLFGFSGFNTWTTYRGFKETVVRDFQLQKLSDRTIYLDEVLTMSAYMGASSGDLKWLKRYTSYEPELRQVIEELIKIDPTIASGLDQTKTANEKLVEYETRAFELLQQNKQQQADNILFGKDYAAQKQIYAQGVKQTLARVQANIDRQLGIYERNLLLSVLASGISIPLLILTWAFALSAVKIYMQARDRAQQGMLDTQTSLQDINATLEKQTQQLQIQEQLIKRENEMLHEDVSNLLDVVSAVEDGNLTVSAPVTERVTGLVSDSFNRLVEQLTQVLTQVSNTAKQITQSSQQLDTSAKTVALNAQQQAQEVSKVLTLTQQVQSSAQDSAVRIDLANQSLESVQSTIEQGQSAINTLTQGIKTLQLGSERIVRRTQDLDEFVGITEQFLQEQTQLAELIQSLTMGAVLLSARTTAQQDPQQMMVLAKEFETIANQIKDLAEQTNQNLRSLQKRTDLLQGTVSVIKQDLQSIDGLVDGYTQEVQKSVLVFNTIQSATQTAIVTGKTVVNSSQQIVETAQATTTAIGDIARLAEQTAELTQAAQKRSEQMEQISNRLLQRIQFFRLPEAATKRVDLSQEQKSTVDITSMAAK